MAALIATRRSVGDEANVEELLEAMRKQARVYSDAGISGEGVVEYQNGLAAFLAGDREKGLVLIKKAVDDGAFILPNVAYLQPLYGHPGFAPIRTKQEARQKRERGKFLTIVCNDNPYEAVWQPEEGTCEEFALQDGQ